MFLLLLCFTDFYVVQQFLKHFHVRVNISRAPRVPALQLDGGRNMEALFFVFKNFTDKSGPMIFKRAQGWPAGLLHKKVLEAYNVTR